MRIRPNNSELSPCGLVSLERDAFFDESLDFHSCALLPLTSLTPDKFTTSGPMVDSAVGRSSAWRHSTGVNRRKAFGGLLH